MISFFSHIPLWVPVIFLFLIAVGLRQMKERIVSTRRAVVVPLVMMAWSATKLVVAPQAALISSLAWPAAFACVVLVCLMLDYPRGIESEDAGRSLRLPGSVLPLALMMLTFAARFASGVITARAPVLAQSPYLIASFGLVYGLVSGLFFARSIAALRATRVMQGMSVTQQKA